MENVVVDTCVISYIFKGDTRATLYEKHLQGKRSFISFVTVEEAYRWAIVRNWGERRIEQFRGLLKHYVVVPYDDQLAWECARIRAAKGKPINFADAWIAATALRLQVPLVTHNRKDFANIDGLIVLSEP